MNSSSPPTQNDLKFKEFIEKKINVGLNSYLGLELYRVKLSNMDKDRESAIVEMTMIIGEKHINAMGIVHGGSVVAMTDTAIGTGMSSFTLLCEFIEMTLYHH